MKNREILLVLVLLTIIVASIYIKKTYSPEELIFTYKVSGCLNQKESELTRTRSLWSVELTTTESSINMLHKINYYCCADIHAYIDSIEQQEDYTLIKIKEKNKGEVCRCICDYTINMNIDNLEKNNYKIQIIGIEFEDMPTEILFEKVVSIGSVNIANPASVHCKEKGGKLEIRKDDAGNEYGVCILPNSIECEEWSFYRGECDIGFCGWSTYGNCTTDQECIIGGCSGQVCQSKNEYPVITTCEWRDCYDRLKYNVDCKCLDMRCRWV